MLSILWRLLISTLTIQITLLTAAQRTTKTLIVVPTHEDNVGAGMIVRMCMFQNEADDGFHFTWKDPQNQIISTSNILRVNIQERPQFGKYVCEAVNEVTKEKYIGYYTIQPSGRTYDISRPSTKRLMIVKTNEENIEAGIIVRQCMFENDGDSEYTFTWKNPQNQIVSTSSILNIVLRELTQFGQYICEAVNDRTQEKHFGFYNIQPSGRKWESHNVVIQPISHQLVLGRPYEVRCSLEPPTSAPVQFAWQFKGREIALGDTLRIASLKLADIGQYMCTAKAVFNEYTREYPFKGSSSIDVRLQPHVRPHFAMSSSSEDHLFTLLGDKRELHCELEGGFDSSDVIWYFNGSRLEHYSPVNRTGNIVRLDYKKVSIISIKGILEEQAGLYECRSQDKVKQVQVYLLSDYKVEVSPFVTKVYSGEVIEIHCMVMGGVRVPNHELRWYFKAQDAPSEVAMDFSNRYSFQRTDDPRTSLTTVISKTRAEKSDEGTYICREPRGQEGSAFVYLLGAMTEDVKLYISPKEINIRPGGTAIISCEAIDLQGQKVDRHLNFRTTNTNIYLKTEKIPGEGIRVTIGNLEISNNGTVIECYTEEANIPSVHATVFVTGLCEPGKRQCRDGTCLLSSRFCDGYNDCSDGSDEDKDLCEACDPLQITCKPHNNVVATKPYIMFHWKCDGEDDCGNNHDESDCLRSDAGTCNDQYFSCPRSAKKIARAYVCDGEIDCENSEDEKDCVAPTITTSRAADTVVRRGDDVTLECTASGNPIPRVIWRYNWKCLPNSGDRFSVYNRAIACGRPDQRVSSTLSIKSVREGDDGIYNCEALEGSRRAMSEDYIVSIRN